jgi:uncharacterized Zn-finger protein
VLVRTFREVMGAGGCRNPVHLLAESVDTETGEILTTDLRIACKDRRSVLCPSCAAVYKADAWFLVTAGLAGGKGMPETLAQHPRLFLTLTAPSFGMVHTTSSDGGCHTRERSACPHGQPRTCTIRHELSDDLLGSPLCEACFDWEGAVLWNAAASRLWNRTIDRVRRVLAAEVGGITAFRRQASLQYLRVAEFQRRGLVHLHAVIRADGPAPTDPPPAWLTVELLERAVRGAVASTSVPTGAGTTATWGTQLDLVDLGATEGDAARVAGYVANHAEFEIMPSSIVMETICP